MNHEQPGLSPAERDIVLELIVRSDPDYATLLTAVIMDDHVHVLARPNPGMTARRLASAWKGASSHRLCGTGGRHAPLWQHDYFDRWMGSPNQTVMCAKYVIENPARRWPWIENYPWVVDRR